MSRWFRSLTRKVRVMIVSMTAVAVLGGIGVFVSPDERSFLASGDNMAQTNQRVLGAIAGRQALIETRTEIETTEGKVPYLTSTTYDGSLPKDTLLTRVEGAEGKKVIRTEVKYRNGVETSRQLISETITIPAVDKVIAVGTKVVKPPTAASTAPKPVPCGDGRSEMSVIAAEIVCDAETESTDVESDQ